MAHPRAAAALMPGQLGLGLRTLILVDSDAAMRQRLAYALKAALAQKGWKAPDLARVIGRDPSTVDRWVNGESVPNLFMVKQIADALGVKPEFIYDPPSLPDYPLSEYLVRQEAVAGVEEGVQRARRRRAAGDA